MEHKRDIDGAALSDHNDSQDHKRVCLSPPRGYGQYTSQFSSQYGDQVVRDAYQATDEYPPSNLDDLTFGDEMNLDQLPQYDVDFEQMFASTNVNPQPLTDCSVTVNFTPQPSVVPSPTPIAVEKPAYKEDRHSEAEEVNTCFGAVRFCFELTQWIVILKGH